MHGRARLLFQEGDNGLDETGSRPWGIGLLSEHPRLVVLRSSLQGRRSMAGDGDRKSQYMGVI